MRSQWSEWQNRWDAALALGESISKASGYIQPPIDPFAVIKLEQGRIAVFLEDFGNAFDGRIEFVSQKFLVFCNTKYNQWSSDGCHHPKVVFTAAHELGHYFIDTHRSFLIKGLPHCSVSDFTSDNVSEREADFFASGLLMPKYLLGRIVNRRAPSIASVFAAREQFRVSLTSMLVRWVQLSDFPCGVVSVKDSHIEWGFTSEPFRKRGGSRVLRGRPVTSRFAAEFMRNNSLCAAGRTGRGTGLAENWIDWDYGRVEVCEDYQFIPSTRQVLVFFTADEFDDDDD